MAEQGIQEMIMPCNPVLLKGDSGSQRGDLPKKVFKTAAQEKMMKTT